ncbi:exosortase A [Duganella sp. SG902]|uniref:exosortase A n=1 Tax=Duganella sp. SG902 TaxID=2587016 RepID=UPI00159DCBC1|nr:exosortase A [Duganella sp. SG902]NVM78339.1 exosortase A [Duganella sp. SG902]
MNAGRAALLSPRRSPAAGPAMPWQHWPHACLAVALAALLLMHLPTASTMVGIWLRSPTFNHGFLILPVAGWLIWQRRAALAAIAPRPWRPGLLLLACLGLVWMLSTVAHVQVLQQYCLILSGIASVAAILGPAMTAAIAFPLAYTLLAVPFGEIFIPPLVDFTARFTVALLQIGGIPVFHENNFIALPTGNWSVADACSGLRYLIASLALGMLYAGVNYQRPAKRLVFITVALLLPILANGLRACMVVLIGHWSDMQLAAGIDHLIYGWLFFGVVMALLFWCGAHWRDPVRPPPGQRAQALAIPQAAQFIRMAAAAIAICTLWPLLAALVLRPPPPDPGPEPELRLAAPPAPWHASPMHAADWRVLHHGQPQRIANSYRDGHRTVSLQLTWYRHQADGAELLAPVRRTVVSGMPQWEEVRSERRTLTVAGRRLTVLQSVQQAAHYKLLVWRWYRQDGVETVSPQHVKLLLAKARLLGGADAGAEIVLAAGYDEQADHAEAAMRDFLTAMLPAIDRSLRHVER